MNPRSLALEGSALEEPGTSKESRALPMEPPPPGWTPWDLPAHAVPPLNLCLLASLGTLAWTSHARGMSQE